LAPNSLTIVAPGGGFGGVQTLGMVLADSLERLGWHVDMVTGHGEIARSTRPDGDWLAFSWKAWWAFVLRHPDVARRGSVYLHGSDMTRDDSRRGRYLRGLAFDRAKRLLAVSPFARQLVDPPVEPRVQVVGAGILDLFFSRPQQPLPPEDDRLRLTSIGRLDQFKGHDLAIAVAAHLAGRRPVELVIIGEGPDERRLREMAARLSEPGRVRFEISASEGRKIEIIDQSHALLLLSRFRGTEFEGLGLVPIEANARGRPAVVLPCGGSVYAVEPGRTGDLVQVRESLVPEVATAVEKVVAGGADPEACIAFASHFHPARWTERVVTAMADPSYSFTWPAGPTSTPA
jgi:glycosyltransferase involved in cell wall biosynthesis